MTDTECTLDGVTVMAPNALGVALSLGFSALCLFGALFTVAKLGVPTGKDGGAFMRVVLMGIFGGGAGAYYFGRVARKASDKTGELVVNATGVHVGGALVVARGDIVAGKVWPDRRHGALVRLERGGISSAVELQVKDVADGRKLLHSLGLDATQSTSVFKVTAISTEHYSQRRWVGAAGVLLLVAFAIGTITLTKSLPAAPVLRSAVPGLMALLFFLAARTSMTSARVVVGADGVYLRWLWLKRFIAIESIVRAEVVENVDIGWNGRAIVVRLHLAENETLDIPVQRGNSRAARRGGLLTPLVRAQADMLAERINQAVEGNGNGESSAALFLEHDSELLRRGERAVSEWVAALKKLHRDVDGYREPGRVLERLWEVLEDAKAKAEQRAAAAVALSPHLDADGRKRIRIAAQAVVAPKLRIALEAAAGDDEAEMESALEAVAEAESR